MSTSKLLTESELSEIRDKLVSYSSGVGITRLAISSSWSSELSWARNSPSMSSDRREVSVVVFRNIKNGLGLAHINQIDDASLKNVMRLAEEVALNSGDPKEPDDHRFPIPVVGWDGGASTWDDKIMVRSIEESANLIHSTTVKAWDKGLMSSGYLETKAHNILNFATDEFGREAPDGISYGEMTQIQCSATVRDASRGGSGWAGKSSYRLADVSESAIAEKALDRAVQSINPVKVEPGRYTVVLEPQATADLIDHLILDVTIMGRRYAESSAHHVMGLAVDPSLSRIRSKMGSRIVDSRVTISHSIKDSNLGVLPMAGVRDITLIENGVLKELYTDRGLVLNELNYNKPNLERNSYRMEEGSSTTEEMILSTKRGLFVTRLSGMTLVDTRSLLMSGVTRDGLWLIEEGKIVKAVRNFRFLESPLYALSNIEEIGQAERVFHPRQPSTFMGFTPQMLLSQVIVPSLKVRDFSFTSTIDAI